MNRLTISLTALLLAAPALAQTGDGTGRAGTRTNESPTLSRGADGGGRMKAGGGAGAKSEGSRGGSASTGTGSNATGSNATGSNATGSNATVGGSPKQGGLRNGHDGDTSSQTRGRRSQERNQGTSTRQNSGSRSQIKSRTSTTESVGRRGGRIEAGGYTVIQGRRVLIGSPEYRRLTVREEGWRGGRKGRRYVTIRGQRVLYGSPQYRRLIVDDEPSFIIVNGRRWERGSVGYRENFGRRELRGGTGIQTNTRSRTTTQTNEGLRDQRGSQTGSRSQTRQDSTTGIRNQGRGQRSMERGTSTNTQMGGNAGAGNRSMKGDTHMVGSPRGGSNDSMGGPSTRGGAGAGAGAR